MSLRERARRDLRAIVENRAGFGWPVVLTSPQSVTYPDLTGLSTDISQMIDPETGMLVSGRTASVSLTIDSLREAGAVELPRGVEHSTEKPWLVTFADIEGTAYTFKVQSSRPDRAIGLVVCLLEVYRP